MWYPIRVDIFTTYNEEYRRHVSSSGEAYLVNPFAAPLLSKIETSHTPCRKYKYSYFQEGLPGPPKYRDICWQNIPKFAMCKYWYYSGRDWRKRIFCRQSPSGAQVRNLWWKNIQCDANNAKLRGQVKNLESSDCHLILCAKQTSSWLTVRGTTVTGTVLAAT